jgi:hypothetical protein
MKRKPSNPNDHTKVTPKTKGRESDDKKFTSYDTTQEQTESPQKVRENQESQRREKK